jgi:GTP-binding protein
MAPKNRYRQTRFLTSAHGLEDLPPDNVLEVAFAGRSNCGKSSALNAIVARKALARTSRTPGRTQLINLFEVTVGRHLVDLPGYGYAKVPARVQRHWQHTLEAFLSTRESLQGLVLLMDARHPMTALDQQMLEWSRYRRLPVHVLLTKSDKLSRGKASAVLQSVRRSLRSADDLASVQLFAAPSRLGVEEVCRLLDRWLQMNGD